MKNNLSNIKKSRFYLDKNECIGIPTETVYGLAGNAYSDIAASKIFKLKKRIKKNPLIVHYYNLDLLDKDCHINSMFIKLYKKFCPGPITFILKKKRGSKISNLVTNNKKTLAVRFPKHKLTRSLLKILDYPLAAPSANISTKISPTSREDVVEDFGNKLKFVLNGGRSKVGLESTIVSLLNKPEILRLGGTDIKEINKTLKMKLSYKKKRNKILEQVQSRIQYNPGIPIRLNVIKPKESDAFILIKRRKIFNKNFFYLTKNKNLKEAAKNLYKILRLIKKQKFKTIAVERIPNKSFGQAINDRLKRASKFK